MRNLANVHQSTQKCQKWDFDGLFLPKVEKKNGLKFTNGLCAMTMKTDSKFEEESTFRFKIDMNNLANFDRST